MRRNVLAVLMAVLVSPAVPAEEWIVEATYADPAMLARVGGQFDHLIVDRERGRLVAETDATGIRLLEGAGMQVRIDIVASAARHALQPPGMSIESIPDFACYRTIEETAQGIDDLVVARPQLAEVEDIGPSWEREQSLAQGHRMRVLRVTNLATIADDPDRPRMVMFGSIHAREYAPAELLTRFAEWLVGGHGVDARATWLVDHVDFRFVLHANPDGRKRAETGILWRKNTNTTNHACPNTPSSSYHAGIDLNRNFPFHWNSAPNGSSGLPCNAVYRGPAPASEPETRNLIRYVAGIEQADGRFEGGALPDRKADGVTVAAPEDYAGLFFDIHSYSELVLWPWSDVMTPPPNAATLQALGRRIAWFNSYTPQRAVELYPTDGGTIDTFYGQLGAPSFVMEIGTTFFQSCGTFESTVLPRNLAALTYAARVARAPYRLGSGPDAHTIRLARSRVVAGEDVAIEATIDDRRYRTTVPAQPTSPITAAYAYIDTPPWADGAVAITLDAVDGTFNATSETVSGVIGTGTLAAGRHLVYVQGNNALGGGLSLGAPDAVFLDVIAVDDAILLDGFDENPD